MDHQTLKSLNTVRKYLERQFSESLQEPDAWREDLQLHICIPSYCEEGLEDTLSSLSQVWGGFDDVTVWVNLNEALEDTEAAAFHQQQQEHLESRSWPFALHVLHHRFPAKKAGVGMARKTVTDRALLHGYQHGQANVLLVALDGDCTVAPNYLEAIRQHAAEHPNSPAFSLQFEHPLEGLPAQRHNAIVAYELHLRLYRYGLQRAGHPYAFHTVGSSMAARGIAYAKQGGMNTKKAGEDFYFLNKLMHLGGFTHCGATCVYPSARTSQRVPFGTGRAMEEVEQGKVLSTYNPAIYETLAALFTGVLETQTSPEKGKALVYLAETFHVKGMVQEVAQNTASASQFQKRWFQKVDLFFTMKMIHALRDTMLPNVTVEEAFEGLFPGEQKKSRLEMLVHLRSLDSKLVS